MMWLIVSIGWWIYATVMYISMLWASGFSNLGASLLMSLTWLILLAFPLIWYDPEKF